jgi:dihydrofolate reductase
VGLILISAMTSDRVIGSENGLPWNIPEEYEQFLGFVSGHPVIMGRTSYEIFGPDLGDSSLYVVSRSLESLPDARVCPNVEAAIEGAFVEDGTVFSAGGASIYRATLPVADQMYLSFVKGAHAGDTHFPEWNDEEWTVVRSDDHHAFEFRVYQRLG